MRVILGDEFPATPNWLSTTRKDLDPLDIKTYYAMFKKADSVDAFLMEHVLEHYTKEDAKKILANIHAFLKPNGYLRAAVPDANFKDPDYQRRAAIGGPGPASTHKEFYDYKTFTKLLEEAGFKVKLLEFCDEEGHFHYNEWNPEDGMIHRSMRFSEENTLKNIKMLSLIVDAYK